MPMEKLCGHHEDNPSGMFLMIPTMMGEQKAAALPDQIVHKPSDSSQLERSGWHAFAQVWASHTVMHLQMLFSV
jgi:hypothetical protein